MRFGYVVVEGPHDEAFIGRLLRELWQFRRIRKEKKLPLEWEPLVPKTFPHGGDLLKRVPVPTFFANDTHSVAVHSATSDNKIPEMVQESLSVLRRVPDAVAVVIDADHRVALPGSEWVAINAQYRMDKDPGHLNGNRSHS